MYSLYDYGWMIEDRGRTTAYLEALQSCVHSQSVVVEIGTGPGVLALLAARLGARKIYAIESGDVIEYARGLAAANGLAARIEFLCGMSTKIELPEKADIIVSDLHGALPFFEQSLVSLLDARVRFLKDGGSFIPLRETLWAALVEAPDSYRRMVGMWNNDVYGIDMTPLRGAAASDIRKHYFTSRELVTPPRSWAELNYTTLTSANIHGEVTWEVEKDCAAHGFCVWFDWEAAETAKFSNSPHSGERHIYGQAFFPWPSPLALAAGDRVHIGIHADMVRGSYLWRWKTHATSPEGGVKGAFQQSTFEGNVSSPEILRKLAHDHIPALNEAGTVDRVILSRIGSGATLAEIAREVAASFPRSFPSWTDALRRVGELSVRYSE